MPARKLKFSPRESKNEHCTACIGSQLTQYLVPDRQLMTCVPFAVPQISGQFKVDGSGNVDFTEEDGIDYAAVTVQVQIGLASIPSLKSVDLSGKSWRECLLLLHHLMVGGGGLDVGKDAIPTGSDTLALLFSQLAGGERVPFLFTIKELNAKGTLDGFGGDFMVPSYRGSSFLDPKVLPPLPCRQAATALPVCRVTDDSICCAEMLEQEHCIAVHTTAGRSRSRWWHPAEV